MATMNFAAAKKEGKRRLRQLTGIQWVRETFTVAAEVSYKEPKQKEIHFQ